MKKLIAFLICLFAVFSLAACGSDPVPDTFTDTLEAAEKLIGFKLSAPDSIDGSTSRNYRATGRKLEIMYFSGNVLRGRVCKDENPSGVNAQDYGYIHTEYVQDGKIEYTLCGSEGGENFSLAMWE
ncbi:MAG: hypothetical protein E7472_05205, partial [Ruminococcaceae bacterium]|nr:hypothetical protein [Oscillospiraceae bacterium]